MLYLHKNDCNLIECSIMKTLNEEKHDTDLKPFKEKGACGYKNKESEEIEVP